MIGILYCSEVDFIISEERFQTDRVLEVYVCLVDGQEYALGVDHLKVCRLVRVYHRVIAKLDELHSVECAKPFFVLGRFVMLPLIVDGRSEVRVLLELVIPPLAPVVTPVVGWGNMILQDAEVGSVILEEGQDVAPETCDTPWCLLDSHLWSADREEVVHLVLSEIAVLNHVSGNEATLT